MPFNEVHRIYWAKNIMINNNLGWCGGRYFHVLHLHGPVELHFFNADVGDSNAFVTFEMF